MIIAVDPGPTESAIVKFNAGTGEVVYFGKLANEYCRRELSQHVSASADHLAIEMIASYGMAVGREVFETCVAIGRFVEAWGRPFTLVYRRDVKLHLCGNVRAKDSNIRQALIDRYGGKDAAIGKKAKPGPLYGIAADVWAALGVACTFGDGAKLSTTRDKAVEIKAAHLMFEPLPREGRTP